MIMRQYKINDKLKKEIQKKFHKESGNYLFDIFFQIIIALLPSSMFFIVIRHTWGMEPVKKWLMVGLAMFVPFALAIWLYKTKFLPDSVPFTRFYDESIVFEEYSLVYSYKQKPWWPNNQTIFWRIPYESIKKIEFDKEERTANFIGTFHVYSDKHDANFDSEDLYILLAFDEKESIIDKLKAVAQHEYYE